MSTRCNILVTMDEKHPDYAGAPNPNNGPHVAQYYRHWDGSPTGAGLDLALKLLEMTRTHGPNALDSIQAVCSALRGLLTLDYEAEGSQGGPGEPNLHGDIEWLYEARFDDWGLRLLAYEIGGDRSWPRPRDAKPATTLLKIKRVEYNSKQTYSLTYWDFKALNVGSLGGGLL